MVLSTFKNIFSVTDDFKEFNFMVLGGAVYDCIACENYNDIDIFFKDEKDFLALNTFFETRSRHVISTSNAITYIYNYVTVQLINRQFGSVESQVSTFDLNKCKVGLLFQNNVVSYYEDKSFNEKLHILKFNETTLDRFLKYKGKEPSNKYDLEKLTQSMHELLELEKLCEYYVGLGRHEDVSGKEALMAFIKEHDEFVTVYTSFLDGFRVYQDWMSAFSYHSQIFHKWAALAKYRQEPWFETPELRTKRLKSIYSSPYWKEIVNKHPDLII